MTYKKIGFRDRLDSNPTTYFVDGEIKEIIKDNSGVSEEGTSLNASNFNHLEDGILQNSRDIEVINKTVGNTSKLETKNKENLVGAINEVFTDVDDGKKGIYGAIVDKGTTPSSQNFKDLESAIKDIKTGEGTAQPKDVLEDKTFTNDKGFQNGTMPNRGEITIKPSKITQSFPKGFYSKITTKGVTGHEISVLYDDFKPNNIRYGVDIGGVIGSFCGDVYFQNYTTKNTQNDNLEININHTLKDTDEFALFLRFKFKGSDITQACNGYTLITKSYNADFEFNKEYILGLAPLYNTPHNHKVHSGYNLKFIPFENGASKLFLEKVRTGSFDIDMDIYLIDLNNK